MEALVRRLAPAMLLLLACPSEDLHPQDLPPSAPAIELHPPSPLSSDWLELELVTPAVDPEGAAVEHRIRWTVDGSPLDEVDDLEVIWPELTLPGQVWEVSVHAVDPSENGGLARSAALEILGTPPSISGVALRPTGPTLVDTLRAVPRDWVDPDGDPPNFRYQWLVGGEPAGADSDVLGPEHFSLNDAVSVVATPLDSLVEGAAVESRVAFIRPPDECRAVRFDGVDDWGSTVGFLQNLRDDFTIEAWLLAEGGGERVVLSTETEVGGWTLLVDGMGRPVFEAVGEQVVSTSAIPADGALHHVAVGRRASEGTVRLWLDGAPVGEELFASLGENGVLFLGRRPGGGDDFAGVLDDVRLSSLPRYNAEFTPERYWPSDGFTTGLWHFSEGEGVESMDATGGGRAADLEGPVWVDEPTACDGD